MAKKSFKENPALSFISQALMDHAQSDTTNADDDVYAYTHKDASTYVNTRDDTHTDTLIDVQKPTVAENASAPPVSSHSPAQAASGSLPSITGRMENKSKRLQLLLRPSTFNGIASLAKQHHTSVNDVINQILELYLNAGE